MTDNKQIKEMPICVNCVHAYVCEEYNLYRDTLRKRCAYHNDHFLDIEQYKKKVCKETAEKFVNETINRKQTLMNPYTDDESECVSTFWIYKLAKQFGVEIKEFEK